MNRRPDKDYDRIKNTFVKCEYCGVEYKYGSIKKHQERKHNIKNPTQPVKQGQVNYIKF